MRYSPEFGVDQRETSVTYPLPGPQRQRAELPLPETSHQCEVLMGVDNLLDLWVGVRTEASVPSCPQILPSWDESLCQIKQNVHCCAIGPVRYPNIPSPECSQANSRVCIQRSLYTWSDLILDWSQCTESIMRSTMKTFTFFFWGVEWGWGRGTGLY